MEKQEIKFKICKPPSFYGFESTSSESNALYYRSNVDQKEYILFVRSVDRSEMHEICKYDIERDQYISTTFSDRLRSPNLCHMIQSSAPHNHDLLTIICSKNRLSSLNLHNSEYIDHYLQSNLNGPHSSTASIVTVWTIVLGIFVCNCSVFMACVYTFVCYLLSHHISDFTHKFERDIKCVIPQLECLYNIQSCVVDGDSIHFIANNQHQNKGILTHLRFDLKSGFFMTLHTIDVNYNELIYGETEITQNASDIAPYKVVYVRCMKTLIMFTNSENIWYYDLNDDEQKWRLFEDVKLPKIPGGEYNLNIICGFTGIVFLFYYCTSDHQIPSDGDTFTYCWDLLFSGNMFECDHDSRYPSNNVNHSNPPLGRTRCVAVNTDTNWTHFIGERPVPFHFKIELIHEIPIELTIIHLQYFHILIKQYILETIHHKIPNDVEMMILDYFPMFL